MMERAEMGREKGKESIFILTDLFMKDFGSMTKDTDMAKFKCHFQKEPL
jgi:hypothetical protein